MTMNTQSTEMADPTSVRRARSLNRLVIFVVVLGYVVVNVGMQIDFFAGHNIFDKYQHATSDADALDIAQNAYYAKTGFLLLMLILMTLRVRFESALAVAFTFYATAMLAFFGVTVPTTLYAVAAAALLGSLLYDRRLARGPAV